MIGRILSEIARCRHIAHSCAARLGTLGAAQPGPVLYRAPFSITSRYYGNYQPQIICSHYGAKRIHRCRFGVRWQSEQMALVSLRRNTRCSLAWWNTPRVYSTAASEQALSATSDLHINGFTDLITAYNQLLASGAVEQEKMLKVLTSEEFSKSLLTSVLHCLQKYHEITEDVKQLKAMISERDLGDEEILTMAAEDLSELERDLEQLRDEIYENLLSEESVVEAGDIILEVTAGVGGQEAMLFTKQVFEMYVAYAAWKGWDTQLIATEYTDLGGLRHAMVNISGAGVYRDLKFEGGVHRVQRVPKTEKSGRVHTSTMTVAILPQPHEVDIYLNPRDLKIETCRASGKGGQHVNTTDSAVRVVHLPTGISAECQNERSQLRNRETALRLLSSRLYEIEQEKSRQKQVMTRKLQVGSANRNEKIRTYNVKDDRVTDHRLKNNLYGVEEFLQGGNPLGELMENLRTESKKEELMEKLQKLTALFVKAQCSR